MINRLWEDIEAAFRSINRTAGRSCRIWIDGDIEISADYETPAWDWDDRVEVVFTTYYRSPDADDVS